MKLNNMLYIFLLLFITIFNSSCTTDELDSLAENVESPNVGSPNVEVPLTFVDTIAPTAPSGLVTTSKSSSSIGISWDASTDNVAVSGYRVYRNDSFINTSTSTNYIDDTVSANTNYSYVVSAFDAVNNFTISGALSVSTPATEVPPVFVDTIAPTAPSGLVTTFNSSSSIGISWDASTDNVAVSGYRIYRNNALISTVISTSYIDNTVSASSAYGYEIRAFDAVNNVTASNALTVNTPAVEVPPAPGTYPPAAYYMSPTGSGTECSLANPCGTFVNAFNAMSGGDTLIVMNGTYTQNFGEWEYVNGIDVSTSNPPSGTASNPTIIRAENNGWVKIFGSDMDMFLDASFVEVEGFSFISNSGGIGRIIGNNNTIRATSFQGNDVANEDTLMSILGDNNLLEDSWVFGTGRSGIVIGEVYQYSGVNNTLRRVVVRLDNYNGNMGFIGIVLYQAYTVTLDNVFVLDFGTSNTTFEYKGGIRSRFGGSDHNFYGTMVLNMPYDGFISSTTNCENCVAWDTGRGIWQEKYSAGLFNKTTVGESIAGIQKYDNVLNNTLVYNSTGTSNIGGQYNHFYLSPSTSQGSNSLTEDPQIKHITRVEVGTPGYQSGLNGETRGAEIINRYVDGVLTNEPLWPYPNENRIMQDMCDPIYLATSGRTGSSLPGMCKESGGLYGGPATLTSYIWEYLGSACPAEYCSFTTPN